jgi:hypothetical protein
MSKQKRLKEEIQQTGVKMAGLSGDPRQFA